MNEGPWTHRCLGLCRGLADGCGVGQRQQSSFPAVCASRRLPAWGHCSGAAGGTRVGLWRSQPAHRLRPSWSACSPDQCAAAIWRNMGDNQTATSLWQQVKRSKSLWGHVGGITWQNPQPTCICECSLWCRHYITDLSYPSDLSSQRRQETKFLSHQQLWSPAKSVSAARPHLKISSYHKLKSNNLEDKRQFQSFSWGFLEATRGIPQTLQLPGHACQTLWHLTCGGSYTSALWF